MIMNLTIQLHTKPQFWAVEIKNIRSDSELPAKFESFHLFAF